MSEHITRGRGRPPRADVYRRLDAQIAELRERMGGLPDPADAAGIWRDIWYVEAHHSTAIEGNTLVLTQVAELLREGRAVGNKELREYLEVQGYADASDWVYRQAITPTGLTHPGRVLALAEVRQVHRTAMGSAWSVAPHPDATAREAPGSFREHDIHPFPGGMTPVSWPFVPAEVASWVDQVNSLDSSRAAFPEALATLHCRFEQIHPSRRQRADRTADPQPHSGPSRLSARHHLQARPRPVPARAAASGHGRRKRSGRDAREGDTRQPAPIRHPGRRRFGPARATGRAGDP